MVADNREYGLPPLAWTSFRVWIISKESSARSGLFWLPTGVSNWLDSNLPPLVLHLLKQFSRDALEPDAPYKGLGRTTRHPGVAGSKPQSSLIRIFFGLLFEATTPHSNTTLLTIGREESVGTFVEQHTC